MSISVWMCVTRNIAKTRVEINASLTLHVMFKSSMENLLNDSIQWKATLDSGVRTIIQWSTAHDQQMLPYWRIMHFTRLQPVVVFDFNLEIPKLQIPGLILKTYSRHAKVRENTPKYMVVQVSNEEILYPAVLGVNRAVFECTKVDTFNWWKKIKFSK